MILFYFFMMYFYVFPLHIDVHHKADENNIVTIILAGNAILAGNPSAIFRFYMFSEDSSQHWHQTLIGSSPV